MAGLLERREARVCARWWRRCLFGGGGCDVRGLVDGAGWRLVSGGGGEADGRSAGSGMADDCAVLGSDEQAADGAAFARRGEGVWVGGRDPDADGVGSGAVWDAAGGGGFGEGVAGAGGEGGAVHGGDDVAGELGGDAGSGFAGRGGVSFWCACPRSSWGVCSA